MSIGEVFPRPTVKEVAFEIRYPNLFFLEDKIGNIQLEVMKEFPESALLFQRHMLLANVGPEGQLKDIPEGYDKDSCKKIWQFKSEKQYILNISSDSLSITSKYHKTYRLEGGHKFRDIIKFVVDGFLKVTTIPIINRIGLRYINECPIPAMENTSFLTYYNTTFKLDRFALNDAETMQCVSVVRKNGYYLRYLEALTKNKETKENVLILDFDGYANKIKSEDYLTTLDSLHEITSNEFVHSIKDPVYSYMRNKEGE